MKGTSFKWLLLWFANVYHQSALTPEPLLILVVFKCTLLFFDWLLYFCYAFMPLLVTCSVESSLTYSAYYWPTWYWCIRDLHGAPVYCKASFDLAPPVHHLYIVLHLIALIQASLFVMHLCLILSDTLLNSLLHTLHSSVIVGNYLALCYKLPAIPFCAMLHHTIYSHLYLLLFTTSLHHRFRYTSRIWLWKPTKKISWVFYCWASWPHDPVGDHHLFISTSFSWWDVLFLLLFIVMPNWEQIHWWWKVLKCSSIFAMVSNILLHIVRLTKYTLMNLSFGGNWEVVISEDWLSYV